MRARTILSLLALPLCAFTCFPQPNSLLAVAPQQNSDPLFAYPESEEGAAILGRLRSFAGKYALKESSCKGVWPSWDREAPCISFTAYTIGVYFVARQRTQRWEILLVKESLAFGQFSTKEVVANFEQTVKAPILEALGPFRVAQ